MDRSYRGLGLVVLMLLVVAPLTLFAVLSLFEDESADSINLSLDGVEWTPGVEGTLLASATPWEPGETRSAIVYVRNDGPDPVDAAVAVLCRVSNSQISGDLLTLTAQVDEDEPVVFPVYDEPHDVQIDGLGSDTVVPLTVTATLADTAPIGTTLDDGDVRLALTITGMRTQESGSPSLLDATGAQLWLAPILLVGGAVVALMVLARRTGRRADRDGSGS